MKITIIGGGNLSHVMSSVLASNGYDVTVITRNPNKWSNVIKTIDFDNKEYTGTIKITDSYENVIPYTDHILLCLPGHVIDNVLRKIQPYYNKKTIIGSVFSSCGFFWMAKKILGENSRIYGFQRVPYMSGTIEYGKIGKITGYKKLHRIGILSGFGDTTELTRLYNNILTGDINYINSHLEISLTNSNPLLHIAKLYHIHKKWIGGIKEENVPLFYKSWENESSELLLKMDNEFHHILKDLPIDKIHTPTILDHYESHDVSSLTNKITSIGAFQKVKTPTILKNGVLQLNTDHRFFQEDIPYGLVVIKSIAILQNKKTPVIDSIIFEFQKIMNKEYYKNESDPGKNFNECGAVQNYGINSIDDLIKI